MVVVLPALIMVVTVTVTVTVIVWSYGAAECMVRCTMIEVEG